MDGTRTRKRTEKIFMVEAEGNLVMGANAVSSPYDFDVAVWGNNNTSFDHGPRTES